MEVSQEPEFEFKPKLMRAYIPTYPALEPSPAYIPNYRVWDIVNGICPKCRIGALRSTVEGGHTYYRKKGVAEGHSAHYYRGKPIESVKRKMYRCNNPECDYENVVRVVQMF